MARWNMTLILGAMAALAGQAAGQDAAVLRESVGSRATDLAKLELQPFDTKLWSTLTDWTNGSALDAGATEGKVVLIATWASWNPAATRVLGTLQSLQDKYGEQGLLVVGVHHPQGWDAAAEALGRRQATFLVAHDASGAFREGIQADQDPDIYLIDRAGQLRFADIRNESVEDGVKLLVAEDVSSASSVRARLDEAARLREIELARPRAIQESVNLRALPEVPFIDPAPERYLSTDWPEIKRDDNSGRNSDSGPTAVPLPGAGWLNGIAPVTRGRTVVYYTWTLENASSGTLCRRMELLQQQLGRDVVVVGVLTRQRDNNRNNDQVEDPAALLSRAERFCSLHDIKHAVLIDPEAAIMQTTARNNSNNSAISTAMVVSSDSVLRWSGLTNDPAFRAALDRVVDADPGIRARRAAEESYIRARGG